MRRELHGASGKTCAADASSSTSHRLLTCCSWCFAVKKSTGLGSNFQLRKIALDVRDIFWKATEGVFLMTGIFYEVQPYASSGLAS